MLNSSLQNDANNQVPSAESSEQSALGKRFLALLLLGLLGAAVLYLLAPAAISLVDIALLVVAVAAGVLLAQRVRLTSLVADRVTRRAPIMPRLRSQVLPAFAAGLVLAFLITLLDFALLLLTGVDTQSMPSVQTYPLPQLIVGVFYGGITEELLLRWGLMTLLAWLGWRVTRKPDARPGNAVMWGAIILAALLFGAAHLPALAAAAELSALLVIRTVLLNALAGVVYGWIFWRFSLEAGMIAHAATHVGFALFIPLLSALLLR